MFETGRPKITQGVKILLITQLIGFIGSSIIMNYNEIPLVLFHVKSDNFKIWQVLTYWLTYPGSVFGFLFHMIALWSFGITLENRLGKNKLIGFYIFLVLTAGLINMLLNPFEDYLYGASAAIGGMIMLFVYFYPKSTVLFFIFPIKSIYLVVILGILSLFYGAGLTLCGIALGFIYGIYNYPNDNNLPIFKSEKFKSIFGTKKSKYSEKKSNVYPKPRVIDKNEWEKRKVDEILEKISKKGIDSLTKQEKEFLDKVYKNYTSNIDVDD